MIGGDSVFADSFIYFVDGLTGIGAHIGFGFTESYKGEDYRYRCLFDLQRTLSARLLEIKLKSYVSIKPFLILKPLSQINCFDNVILDTTIRPSAETTDCVNTL